ncbi:protein shisa-like-2A [Salvelinus sp. IW2-2015]|uniref:protein shisa-like-2A n=1 Tax=Salvelinus sp. IW2-2015 TaxID=2691554 RepID=UPI0038D4785B
MSSECTSYYSAENVFMNGSSCPKEGSDPSATFCCGFNDIKYCCDDPNSFFPYEYGYMWWLSIPGLEPSEGPSHSGPAPSIGPHGFRKHFFSRKLDCDNQPPDPERMFQRCFVTTVNMEGPS